MPLMPSRLKHRKVQRGSRKGNASSGAELAFGEYGIKALERGWIKNNQLEACRVSVMRHMKRKGRLWIRVFPDKPVTKKPIETRQGKGKGNPESWVAVVKPGMILFEIGGVSEKIAREALRLADAKLGIATRYVSAFRH
ncbi:MAG: 50S ribosomal protein L16 [Kiritimatiellia bacterium]